MILLNILSSINDSLSFHLGQEYLVWKKSGNQTFSTSNCDSSNFKIPFTSIEKQTLKGFMEQKNLTKVYLDIQKKKFEIPRDIFNKTIGNIHYSP